MLDFAIVLGGTGINNGICNGHACLVNGHAIIDNDPLCTYCSATVASTDGAHDILEGITQHQGAASAPAARFTIDGTGRNKLNSVCPGSAKASSARLLRDFLQNRKQPRDATPSQGHAHSCCKPVICALTFCGRSGHPAGTIRPCLTGSSHTTSGSAASPPRLEDSSACQSVSVLLACELRNLARPSLNSHTFTPGCSLHPIPAAPSRVRATGGSPPNVSCSQACARSPPGCCRQPGPSFSSAASQQLCVALHLPPLHRTSEMHVNSRATVDLGAHRGQTRVRRCWAAPSNKPRPIYSFRCETLALILLLPRQTAHFPSAPLLTLTLPAMVREKTERDYSREAARPDKRTRDLLRQQQETKGARGGKGPKGRHKGGWLRGWGRSGMRGVCLGSPKRVCGT